MQYLKICFLFLLFLTGCPGDVFAQDVFYSPKDSIRVELLLAEGRKVPADQPLTLFFARKFADRPYVSHTLDYTREEHLSVNLGSLDCTTLVDNVCALALATAHGCTHFRDFCYWLRQLRYAGGRIDGYTSRNHYFSQWIQSNTRLSLVREVEPTAGLASPLKINLTYMSSHPASYPLLRRDASEVKRIREMERKASGATVRYIPKDRVGGSREALSFIHDGDILAITTRKAGLDVSHVGFAVWGKDGQLHLLNASSEHHRVLLEPMTLHRYLQRHASQTGIRIIRLLVAKGNYQK